MSRTPAKSAYGVWAETLKRLVANLGRFSRGAKKALHAMQKKLHQMSKGSASGKELADFEALEHLLER